MAKDNGKDKAPDKGNGDKVKAARMALSELIVISAFERTFSTGKKGWFGQVQDPHTGTRFQVIGAVQLVPKA